MAIVITGPNIQPLGDQGKFESDRSTWGFPDTSICSFERSGLHQTQGLFSSLAQLIAIPSPVTPTMTARINRGGFDVIGSTKYLATAKVRVPSSALIGAAENKLSITIDDVVSDFTETKLIETTVGDATDTWVEIQTKFEVSGSATRHLFIWILLDRNEWGPFVLNGKLYVDEFYVYPIEEISDVCSLQIDIPGTVIVNETGPGNNNGSIDVAITGGTPPLEYSKDGGGSWQDSNQFTGLTAAVYNVQVREKHNPTCLYAQSFAVNQDTLTFDFTSIVTHETVSGAADGRIEITVTGTGGPFTFSKGASFGGSNIFQNLAPATYTIVVKDASDNILAKNITVNPGIVIFERVYFSKNPIEYVIAKIPLKPNVHNDVRVEIATGTSIYLSQLKSELEAISNKAKFSLRPAFRGVLTANAPAYNSNTPMRLTDRIKLYKNYYGGIDEDETTPAAIFSSNPFLVMLGGIDKLRFPTLNYFTDYLPTNKKFLTWAPMEKEVQRQQEDYLNFWVYGLFISALKLIIKAYYDDGTDQTATISTTTGVQYGQLYQIPAGSLNSGVGTINPAKNLVKYELWLTDQADSLISEVRTYRLAPYTHPLTRYFMFLNSLGAYEVMYFKGQADITAKVQKDIIQKHLPSDYSALQGEFETNNGTLRDEGNYSSGYFKGVHAAAWQEYMKDFLLSSRVYELVGQTRKPVNVITDSFQYKVDQDYKHFVQFRTTEAYENDSFTPASI